MPSSYIGKRAEFTMLERLAINGIGGLSTVNKFGAAPSGVQTTPTDIWTRADATPTQQVWLAPTAARVHSIVSTSTADASGGTGALSVIVYGLTDWDTAETSETVTLTGTDAVNTVNSYVIIHRMTCVAQSTTTSVGINVGTISATAATDGTITAVVGAGDGQTEMAIYGVPSTKNALLKRWTCHLNKAGGAVATADFILRVNENPNVQTLGFIRKYDLSLQSTGASSEEYLFQVLPKFPGPCIIKVTATASAADVDAKSGFDLILSDK